MKTYSDKTGLSPDFEVQYSFLSNEEGGRESPPYQHTRWDFLYEKDSHGKDGVHMIWPEFVDTEGNVLPEGPIPKKGRARMFVINAERRSIHCERIRLGTMGYMMEGGHRVARCTVTQVLSLHTNPRD